MKVLVTCGSSGIMADVVSLLREIPAISSIMLADAQPIAFEHGCETARVPLGRSPEYPRAMRDLVDQHGIEFLFVGSDEEALALSRLEWARGMSHLDSHDRTALVIDKYRLHEALAAAGGEPLVPDFRRCASGPELRDMVAAYGSVIERPVHGRGSKGLRHFVTAARISDYPQATAVETVDPSADGFHTAYLPGDKFSADCIFDNGTLLTCMARNNGPAVKYRPPTMEAQTSDDPAIFSFASRVGKALSLSGFHQIECGRSASGDVRLIEINPRLDATLPITRCYDQNFYELLLERRAAGFLVPRRSLFKRFTIAYTK